MSNSTVRMASIEDIDVVLSICKQFHNEVDWPFDQSIDEEHMRNTYPKLLESGMVMFL